MDWLSQDAKDLLSFVADSLSIFGITIVSIWSGFYAVFKRNRDYVATLVSLYLAYFLKSVLIFFILAFIGIFAWELIRAVAFIERQPIIFSIAITLLIGAFAMVVIWLFGTMIWTLSVRHVLDFLRVFGFKIKRDLPKLEILYAWYGTETQNIDVTRVLSNAIINNKLKIQACNELAGDPHVSVYKKMVVQYRYDSKISKATIDEGKFLELPIMSS